MVKLLEKKAIIHADCEINGSKFGKYTEVGCGSIILNSNFGDYSYCTRYCDIANTEIKKFSNIASFVRIGPTDHPCLLYTSPSPRDLSTSRMPSSA